MTAKLTWKSALTSNVWAQQRIILPPYTRGFHLITNKIVESIPQLHDVEVGMLHLMLQHTSASLTINENADPTVRQDLEAFFMNTVSEDTPYFTHTYEGPDDMPAHIKSSLLGCELSIPITNGRLNLGTWQGITLGEHRNHGTSRHILATIQGLSKS